MDRSLHPSLWQLPSPIYWSQRRSDRKAHLIHCSSPDLGISVSLLELSFIEWLIQLHGGVGLWFCHLFGGSWAAFLVPFVYFLRYWEVGIRVFTQKPSWGLSVVLTLLKLTIYVEGGVHCGPVQYREWEPAYPEPWQPLTVIESLTPL